MSQRLVMVQWSDSTITASRWVAEDETLKITSCTSVGWIVDKTKNRIVIAGHRIDETGAHAGLIAIPRVAITSMRKLGKA